MKAPISILITAYQAEKYIEECLDSIENQTYFNDNNDFEVLVGVDACEFTLNKLKQISYKYRNLRIFMMDNNQGTYITMNTLLDIAIYENLIRFDSDDKMKPYMIEKLMQYSDSYDIIKFMCENFGDIELNTIHTIESQYRYAQTYITGYGGAILRVNPSFDAPKKVQKRVKPTEYSCGTSFFKKKVFDIYGGYMPWICAADYELMNRIGDDLNIKQIDEVLFYRRIHRNSLTQNEETGIHSEKRNEYLKIIAELKQNNYQNVKVEIIDKIEDHDNKKHTEIINSKDIELLEKNIEEIQNYVNAHQSDETIGVLFNLYKKLPYINKYVIENINK
jgi:glycosyltransferase involved in cell wall biosynthesis